jgi:hypothetical protein
VILEDQVREGLLELLVSLEAGVLFLPDILRFWG